MTRRRRPPGLPAGRPSAYGDGMPLATPPTAERFEGFADREGHFFRALARNQRREWFETHRREYEEGWLAPMKALLAHAWVQKQAPSR